MKREDRPIIVMLAVLIALVAFLLAANSAPQCNPAQQTPATKEQHDHNHASAGIGVILYSPFCVAGEAIYAHREVLNAASTLVIGAFTVMLFIATFLQYRQLRATLELGNRDFEATHRPWITISGIKIGDVKLFETSLLIDVSYTLRNVGGSPAYAVFVAADIFYERQVLVNRDRMVRWCDAIRKDHDREEGDVLFPKDERRVTDYWRLDLLQTPDLRHLRYNGVKFAGVVQYKFMLDKTIHQTRFAGSILGISISEDRKNLTANKPTAHRQGSLSKAD